MRGTFAPKYNGEGGPFTKLREAIQVLGYNVGGRMHGAIVTSDYPNLSIRLDVDTIDTPNVFLTCNPQLIHHTETVNINGQEATIEYPNRLVKGARVLVFEAEHQQDLYVIALSDK